MIAHGFVVNGAKVYISSRSAKVCDKVAEELSKLGPGQCISIPADLQSLDEVKRLSAEIGKRESSKSPFPFFILFAVYEEEKKEAGRGEEDRHGLLLDNSALVIRILKWCSYFLSLVCMNRAPCLDQQRRCYCKNYLAFTLLQCSHDLMIDPHNCAYFCIQRLS